MEGTALADRLQDKVAGACLIVGALLMTPNTFFEYREGALFWAGVVGAVAYGLLIPGLLGVARLLRERAPRLAVFGGLLVALGGVGGVFFSTAPLFEWAQIEAGTPGAQIVAVNEVVEGRVFPVLFLFGALFPISLLLLSVGLFRTGAAPRWVALLLGAGALLYPMGHAGESALITHLAEFALLIPLAWIGVRFLTDATPSRRTVPATT